MGKLNVTGTGEVTATPDMASISVNVITEAKDSAAALKANNERVDEIFRLFDKSGIEKKDQRTEQFSVSPKYTQSTKKQSAQIDGWRVSNNVTAKIRNLGDVGSIIAACGKLGAVQGPFFANSKAKELQDQARCLAMKNAVRKAKLLCESIGIQLGELSDASEIQHHYGYAQSMRAMAPQCAGGGGNVPVEAGEQTITMQMQCQFNISGAIQLADQEAATAA